MENQIRNAPANPPSLNGRSDEDIDIKRYIGLFLSNWYWFALFLFIAGLIAYGINTYSEKIYTVSSSLLIKDDQSETEISGQDMLLPGGNLFRSRQNLQNEIGILKSFSLNNRVMKELKDFHVTIVGVGRRGIAQIRHYKSAPFVVIFDSTGNQNIGQVINLLIRSDTSFSLEINGRELKKEQYLFGEDFKEADFDFNIKLRDSLSFKYDPELSNRYMFWFNKPESLANSYRSKLRIEPVNEEATLVNLSVSGVVPRQEAEYLNMLMMLYITQGLEFKNETAEKTIKFIEEQISAMADSLSRAEKKLEDFRLSNRFLDLSAEGATILKRLEVYSEEKVKASLQQQYYRYLENYIESRNELEDVISPAVMGVTDPVLINHIEEMVSLQEQKKQYRYTLTPNQPAINLINSKIDDTRARIDENVNNNIKTIEANLEDINSRIMKVESELNRLPGTERKLINIQREFDLNNTVYTYMLEKRSEAGIALASNVSSNRIIDRASSYNASRIKPRERRNYILALIIGLMIPGIYILLVDQLHNKIIDKKDIEKGTQVPIVGFIGHNTIKSELPVIEKPGSSLSESFRSIRTNLKYYIKGRGKAVISVTSTISGEGKTFVSLNLAAILAMIDKKTLLIGVDLRKPRLDKILNFENTPGLTDFLIGECTMDEIIKPTETNNLYFVPAGTVPPNPSELLESEKMEVFMKKMTEEFDFVVLDTPPVGIVSDALLLGKYADINIFVIRQKFSFKSTLELIQGFFERDDLKNLIIAVNDIHITGYYGYGLRYGYGFYEGYGYSYGNGNYGSYGQGDYHKYYTDE